MKKALLLAIPVAALAVAATALGQSNRSNGPASAGVNASSLIKCGNWRAENDPSDATTPWVVGAHVQCVWCPLRSISTVAPAADEPALPLNISGLRSSA